MRELVWKGGGREKGSYIDARERSRDSGMREITQGKDRGRELEGELGAGAKPQFIYQDFKVSKTEVASACIKKQFVHNFHVYLTGAF